MAYSVDKNKGEIVFGGWEKGTASSPHNGIGDIRCANISTDLGEVSVNFSRARQDNAAVVGGTFTVTNGNTSIVYTGTTLKNGTWILVTAISGSSGFSNNNYYFVTSAGGNNYNLTASFNGVAIVPGSSGTLTFNTLNLGNPIDYAVEQTTTFDSYRYYILDSFGVVWISGAGGTPGLLGRLTSSTVWSAISPNGSSTGPVGTNPGGLAIIYGTTSGLISTVYLLGFADAGIKYMQNPAAGGSWTGWKSVQYTGGFSHRAILCNDQVVYYCDGPIVGAIYQNAPATPFDPNTASTYTFTAAQYYLNPTDASTRIAQIPNGGGVGIIVGGMQNNLYTYPSAKSSASATGQQQSILWMPESNTQYLLSTNNFVLVFCGSKGNIYLTNGTSVVPLLSVPDYVAQSVNFIQEPYFTWGGAMYLRGRVFFSIQDQTASHTGNCGGVWSFIPNFGVFSQQDTGTALRLENRPSGTLGATAYNGYASVIFAGQDTQAQGGASNVVNGPQYVAAWVSAGSANANLIDFSSTTPYTDGSTIIETDFVPVGTIFDKKTFEQIEYKLAANLVAGESVAINYRTSLEAAFATAGTVITETTTDISGIIKGVAFQKVQNLQLQIVLTAVASNSSFVRLKNVYVR